MNSAGSRRGADVGRLHLPSGAGYHRAGGRPGSAGQKGGGTNAVRPSDARGWRGGGKIGVAVASRRRTVRRWPGPMHGQARELRQDRKVATVATFCQCRGVPGRFFVRIFDLRLPHCRFGVTATCPRPTRSSRASGGPQTFDEIVGQDHVVRTLRNAITRNRIAHAYLFVGPRGTGKTSTARIFAKALNCTGGPEGRLRSQRPDLPGHRRGLVPGRDRDRRRLQQRRRPGARAARHGALRAGAGPVQGLHHRRGAHALGRGVQRAAQDAGGAAAAREVRLRHDRRAEGAADDHLALPAVRPEADFRRADRRAAEADRRWRRRSR